MVGQLVVCVQSRFNGQLSMVRGSGLSVANQAGDRQRLFVAAILTGCMPWHPGRVGMY